jgi:hypothetical protein
MQARSYLYLLKFDLQVDRTIAHIVWLARYFISIGVYNNPVQWNNTQRRTLRLHVQNIFIPKSYLPEFCLFGTNPPSSLIEQTRSGSYSIGVSIYNTPGSSLRRTDLLHLTGLS